MNPANPATARDTLAPDTRYFGKVIDGPHAGTFAKVGLAVYRRIGETEYKRMEEPAGSGRYVWRMKTRPSDAKLFNDLEWDEQIEAIRNRRTKPSTNNSE